MLHERLEPGAAIDLVELAAVWPGGAPTPAAPLAEIEAVLSRTAAAPELPATAGKLLATSYIGLMSAFALTMARGGEATFAIAISAFYVVMFLVAPTLFFAIEGDRTRRCMRDFLREGMDTYTGHMGAGAVLAQMLVVPVLLIFATLSIGLIAVVMLP